MGMYIFIAALVLTAILAAPFAVQEIWVRRRDRLALEDVKKTIARKRLETLTKEMKQLGFDLATPSEGSNEAQGSIWRGAINEMPLTQSVSGTYNQDISWTVHPSLPGTTPYTLTQSQESARVHGPLLDLLIDGKPIVEHRLPIPLLLAIFPSAFEALRALFEVIEGRFFLTMTYFEFSPTQITLSIRHSDLESDDLDAYAASIDDVRSAFVHAIEAVEASEDETWHMRILRGAAGNEEERGKDSDLIDAALRAAYLDSDKDMDFLWDFSFGEDAHPSLDELRFGWKTDWRRLIKAPIALESQYALLSLLLDHPEAQKNARILTSPSLPYSDLIRALDTFVVAQGIEPIWPCIATLYKRSETPHERRTLLSSLARSSSVVAARVALDSPDLEVEETMLTELVHQIAFKWEEYAQSEERGGESLTEILLGVLALHGADSSLECGQAVAEVLGRHGGLRAFEGLRDILRAYPDAPWAAQGRETLLRLARQFPDALEHHEGQITLSQDTQQGALSEAAAGGELTLDPLKE